MEPSVVIIVRGVTGTKERLRAWAQSRIDRAADDAAAVEEHGAAMFSDAAADADNEIDRRAVAAGIEALDELWEALPAEDADETGELWGPYQHVRYLLEQLAVRIPEHRPGGYRCDPYGGPQGNLGDYLR